MIAKHKKNVQTFLVNHFLLNIYIYIIGINNIYTLKQKGEPSWGIAWWVNEMLIPEITVERGQNYTFIVEGGNDKTNPAK